MKKYTCREVDVNHSQFIQLRNKNECNLGIDPSDADKLLQIPDLRPPLGSATRAAFIFWNSIGFLILIYAIYLTYKYSWVFFLIGFLLSGMIFSTNKKTNAQNILEDAYTHNEFYEKIRNLNGWVYEMNSEIAERFKRK